MQLLFARPLQAFQAANCLHIRSQGQLHAGASKRYATGFGALRWATIFALQCFILARGATLSCRPLGHALAFAAAKHASSEHTDLPSSKGFPFSMSYAFPVYQTIQIQQYAGSCSKHLQQSCWPLGL